MMEIFFICGCSSGHHAQLIYMWYMSIYLNLNVFSLSGSVFKSWQSRFSKKSDWTVYCQTWHQSEVERTLLVSVRDREEKQVPLPVGTLVCFLHLFFQRALRPFACLVSVYNDTLFSGQYGGFRNTDVTANPREMVSG